MITVLSGGTGTPKLLQGLKNLIKPEDLNIIVNTVENNYFSGVYVAGDIDTVMYTLADMINEDYWYGIKGDTFITNERLRDMGCPELLRIGDMDRSTKMQKTLLLENHTLSEVVRIQCDYLGIKSKVIPMSDEDSDIIIKTNKGDLSFHDFLIKEQMKPEVKEVKYTNVPPSPELINIIENSDKVILGPSNPVTSICPILKIDGVIDALKSSHVVALSPFVGKSPVSGPAGKFINALGYESTSLGLSKLYSSFLDKIVIDNKDEELKEDISKNIDEVIVTNTIMKSLSDKENLARIILE